MPTKTPEELIADLALELDTLRGRVKALEDHVGLPSLAEDPAINPPPKGGGGTP
jgi:hypothetical protein